jgi:hypothetical protein
MTPDPANAGREQDGRFAPGCSGNPAGKKAGTRHKATRAALAQIRAGEVNNLEFKLVDRSGQNVSGRMSAEVKNEIKATTTLAGRGRRR